MKNLREFFLKGGFLWVDDFWGSAAWQYWSQEISRVLPPGEFPMIDIPLTHPIMHTLYDVKEFPQIPRSTSGAARAITRRRSAAATARRCTSAAIQDSRGRLMVLMTHNTDIADSWEREGESAQYFDLFSPRGYAIGVNVVLYAMTH